MKQEQIINLVQRLINATGPCGEEKEIRDVFLRELEKVCDKCFADEAGNAIGLIKGKAGKGKAGRVRGSRPPVIQVMAHLDENSLTVKRVEPDGTLRVKAFGGLFPWVLGLGPVEILGDEKILPGVFSVGPMHVSQETPAPYKSMAKGEGKTLEWRQVYVITRLTPDELSAAGVHAGTRVIIPRSRRALIQLHDCVAGYFLDDRAGLAIMLAAASMLREAKQKPANDVYLIGTCQEENGTGTAAYASARLPGNVAVMLDIGPAAAEYGVLLNREPVICYRDVTLHSKPVCDRLLSLGRRLGMKPQTAVWENYGTDLGFASMVGHIAHTALLCMPAENTHGFEVAPKEGIESCARLLSAYLREPV